MEAIDEVKNALATLQSSVLERISAVERETKEVKDQYEQAILRANRPGLSGGNGGNSEREEEALGHAIKCLIGGDQHGAGRNFEEIKAMSSDVDPSGGYYVVPSFSTEMTKVMLETAPFLGLCRTKEIDSGVLEEPVDRDKAGAEWVGETQSRADTDTPDVGLFRCEVHEIYALPAVSQKLLDTSAIDVMEWLRGKVAEKLAHAQSTASIPEMA